MNTQTRIKFIVEPKKATNAMQEKVKLDVDETFVRRAAQVLDETFHEVRQDHGVTRPIFIP